MSDKRLKSRVAEKTAEMLGLAYDPRRAVYYIVDRTSWTERELGKIADKLIYMVSDNIREY